jgi:ribonucleoside-diphosphate reductase alpha chain
MANTVPTQARTADAAQIVQSLLGQMPELAKLRQIKRRNGEVVEFSAERVAEDLGEALRDCGVKDRVLHRRMLEQVIGRMERQFDGHTVPTTDDLLTTVMLVAIDNNAPYVGKRYLQMRAAKKPHPAVSHKKGLGLRFPRYFTVPGTHPFDLIEWERRDAVITNEKGKVVFEQKGVEIPKNWSQTATNIVVSKYFRGKIGTPEREWSVKQMVGRVASTIADWGRRGGYFAAEDDAEAFEAELTHILANQMAAFNSPVWFNVGVAEKPQCSACFIQSVRDDMRSIMSLAQAEAMLFKGGSGTGSNLSTLRSSHENLGGSSGKSSGPVSFMKGYDAFAGVIKSGGKTRRAAKMVILNVEHPDVREFIWCKAKEEKKAWTLIDSGYDGSLNGEAYASIFFQNANNSVRVTDDFMRAVVEDRPWTTKAVTTGADVETIPARELMADMAKAAWECGDPGIQYDTTVNAWHPCPESGRINASNPCSEYMFLDDTACNLASLNLMKYRAADGEFDVESFRKAVDVIITAQEILVDFSSYPTPAIEENSYDFRPLGIGYANLGALLMSRGLAYDSEQGRDFAAAVTALLSGQAYYQSSLIAREMGPFRAYPRNEKSFLRVIGMHREASYRIPAAGVPADLLHAARQSWDMALAAGREHGYKNAQISVLAPTGTIGFLMDCDTTGVEPDIALVKYKWLVGGGLMKIVNQTVPEALRRLGYDALQTRDILDWIDKNDTIEGAPHLKEEHLPVFDCAFKPAKGTRSIHYMGHVRMMAAVQPFISGAISKTVNMPTDVTVDDIAHVYIEGWKLGLKAIAIYRDGCKRAQPLTTSVESDQSEKGANKTAAKPEPKKEEAPAAVRVEYKPLRRRLPDERRSMTHKFSVANHEGYITVGLYDDGSPGEVFIRMSKGGSVVSGLMDAFATSVSVGLQYGVPLKVLVNKFVHVRFEPSGFTSNPQIRIAKSIIDYLFKWMAIKFMSPEEQVAIGVHVERETLADRADREAAESSAVAVQENAVVDGASPIAGIPKQDPGARQMMLEKVMMSETRTTVTSDALTMTFDTTSDAPACDTCGAIMVRSAACYKCMNCGGTSGCS